MAEPSRIDVLRRRIQKDPASIAFAQLAEEHRRIGEFDEAVRVARAGLQLHPGYLSARVTLGRALLELGRFDDAQPELEAVVAAAPDNLSAIRALAEIHQRRGEMPPADPPRHDVTPMADLPPMPDLPVMADLPPIADARVADEESFRKALASLDETPFGVPLAPAVPDPALDALEAWHAAILRDRQIRSAAR